LSGNLAKERGGSNEESRNKIKARMISSIMKGQNMQMVLQRKGGEHYINNCPDFLEFKKMKEQERQAAATWDVTTFVTYQVNAIGAVSFKHTEVLLDNQANISILRPDLLMAFKKTENGIRVNGVGEYNCI
jgi:hypothetical protein